MLEQKVRRAVEEALQGLYPGLPGSETQVVIELPRDKTHGDYATNVAMTLARTLGKAPRDIAAELVPVLSRTGELFLSVEAAGPGFINFRIAPRELHRGLGEILEAGPCWGESEVGGGERVLVEYVSANPTGPMNVVNARAAAFGATLVRLFQAAGYNVQSEFYVNDVGGQIDLFGASVLARYREERGEGPASLPAEGYEGEYVRDLARGLDPGATDDLLAGKPEAEQAATMGRLAVSRMEASQEKDLERYGVRFDRWFHQSELYPEVVDQTLDRLRDLGRVEEKQGAVWFRSTEFGDDQDRVLVRQNGEPTYFLADLAYHRNKHEREFERVINIWGPDHHGYIGRMQAGMRALGHGSDWLEIIIVQQVNLLSGGKPVKMSKRKGEFITLSSLLEDVEKDTATFFFLMRRAESHLDFDLDLARQESDENPVYYVKYAHARIAGILRKAREEGAPGPEDADLTLLSHRRELDLIKMLLQFPGLVAGAARDREPHRLTNFLREVAQAFHLFYHDCRVVGPDASLTRARLALTHAARTVLANGLALMDIEAPERM
jgi:arginyl-tRNA synthetase